LHEIRSLI